MSFLCRILGTANGSDCIDWDIYIVSASLNALTGLNRPLDFTKLFGVFMYSERWMEHEHITVKMCQVFRPNNDDGFYYWFRADLIVGFEFWKLNWIVPQSFNRGFHSNMECLLDYAQTDHFSNSLHDISNDNHIHWITWRLEGQYFLTVTFKAAFIILTQLSRVAKGELFHKSIWNCPAVSNCTVSYNSPQFFLHGCLDQA